MLILVPVMRMWILQELTVFLAGGAAYVTVELLWRGHSHVSMFVLGAVCFWLIGRMNYRHDLPVAWQACLGACLITALEFLTGLVVNRWLRLGVWDYSTLPMNIMGQVCVYYSFLWLPLSAAAIFLEDGVRKVLFRVPFPSYHLF